MRKVSPNFHGQKGRSGRKKGLPTIIREALDNDVQNLPMYFHKLSELASNGDREAIIYLIDRHLGKPKASSDIKLEGGELLGTGVIVKLFELMEAKRRELVSKEVKQLEKVE